MRFPPYIGANCQEAISAPSTKDYIDKYGIALKEARETFMKCEVRSKNFEFI